MYPMKIRPLKKEDLPQVKVFTDQMIGLNYFTLLELEEAFQKSNKNGVMCSFLLVDGERIMGLRLAYPPGTWSKGKGAKLRPDLWDVPL